MVRSNLVVSMLVVFVGSSRRIVVVLDILLVEGKLLGLEVFVVEGGMLLTLLRLLLRSILLGVLVSLVDFVVGLVLRVLVVLALLMLPFLPWLFHLRVRRRFLFLLG